MLFLGWEHRAQSTGQGTHIRLAPGQLEESKHAMSRMQQTGPSTHVRLASEGLEDSEPAMNRMQQTATPTCFAVDEEAASGGSVEAGVAHYGGILSLEARVCWGHDGNVPSSHALAHIIIGLTNHGGLHA